MKTLLLLLALVGLMGISFAAVSRGNYKNPNHPGKCVINSKSILSPGEHKDPSVGCGRIICKSDGTAELHSCGIAVPPPNCKFEDYKDASRNYPDCCERVIKC